MELIQGDTYSFVLNSIQIVKAHRHKDVCAVLSKKLDSI
jgi:hypothetical protein